MSGQAACPDSVAFLVAGWAVCCLVLPQHPPHPDQHVQILLLFLVPSWRGGVLFSSATASTLISILTRLSGVALDGSAASATSSASETGESCSGATLLK